MLASETYTTCYHILVCIFSPRASLGNFKFKFKLGSHSPVTSTYACEIKHLNSISQSVLGDILLTEIQVSEAKSVHVEPHNRL